MALLEEWGPKGIDVPTINKYKSMDLSGDKSSDALE